jgi:DNA-binding transcriptional regulator of glucitol operon
VRPPGSLHRAPDTGTGGGYPGGVRQLVLSPRWIVWHLLTLGAMVTCGWLAAWQWERAGSAMGSAMNIGYGLQWPVFAVFFGVMWWRLLRMELREVRAAQAPATTTVPAAAAPDRPPGTAAPDRPAAAPSPFTPRPRTAPAVTDDEDPELAAYNRMLARLAERADREGDVGRA